jgi:hypothetical protein
MSRERRKELTSAYREAPPDAGVYRIVNTRDGRSLLGSTTNLRGMENRFQFARSTGTAGALDARLTPGIREHGFEAFTFEVLERLDVEAAAAESQVRRDLAALEQLWAEKLGPGNLY